MKRWFFSKTVWLNLLSGLMDFLTVIANLGAAVIPQAIPLLATIGLTPIELMFWTVATNGAVKVANIYLRFNSPVSLGSKDDHAAFIDMTERTIENQDYR